MQVDNKLKVLFLAEDQIHLQKWEENAWKRGWHFAVNCFWQLRRDAAHKPAGCELLLFSLQADRETARFLLLLTSRKLPASKHGGSFPANTTPSETCKYRNSVQTRSCHNCPKHRKRPPKNVANPGSSLGLTRAAYPHLLTRRITAFTPHRSYNSLSNSPPTGPRWATNYLFLPTWCTR